MTSRNDRNVFQRAWASWMGFWFTAADPTPLCLMRIVAGLLTLYVHIAYSFDLVSFFGPNGWVDHAESNRIRRGIPHVRGTIDWTNPSEFRMPEDYPDRMALIKFIAKLIDTPGIDENLFFMHNMASYGEERNALLRYLEKSSDKSEFEAEIRAFADDRLAPDTKEGLPRYFSLQSTPEARKNFAEMVLRFRGVLSDDYKERSRVLQLLIRTTADDWNALDHFVRDVRNLSIDQREEYLTKYAEWQVPPKYIYAEGMHSYSPWFHTKDVRFLWLIHGLYLLAILAFTLGYQTRVMAVVTWLAGLSYINRAQPYLFGQDTMMNLCLFYLMLSPCGAKWSIDRWMERMRAEQAGRKLPPVAPSVSAGFVLRVFQIQFCLMYFSAGLSKLKGTLWWNGNALHLCMANPEFSPMHVKMYRDFMQWLCSHRLAWELLGTATSVFTIMLEITFPYLVWTRLRPILVSASLLLHTGIAIFMGLSVFSMFMFTLVLCFVPADTINWMFGTEADRAAS